MRERFWDGVFSTASWIVVLALLASSSWLWIHGPTAGGPVTDLLGILGAQIVWSSLFFGEAVVLAYAKWKKKKRLRKQSLMVIYLTGFFTSILSFMLGGLTIRLGIFLVFCFMAAACWLYWTFKTEYISPKYFYDQSVPLRDDLPPSCKP